MSDNFQTYQQLFDQMMKRFDLEAKAISAKAEVSEVMLSRFRHGKADLGASKLIALLLAVPPEARMWYLSELFGQKPGVSLRSQVLQASPEEQAEVLHLMAEILVSKRRSATASVELVHST